MDEETRAYFEEMRHEFAGLRGEFAGLRGEFADSRGESDSRFQALDAKIDRVRREAGTMAEHLLDEIKLVAEVARDNGQAIERLRGEMNARFHENEVVVHAAFAQLRRDIEEPRDHR
jgi:hypothetical protein